MSTIAMRSVSALTVLGLSLGTAAVGAPIAFATPSTVQIPSSTINFGEKGSLTIDMRAVASYDNDVVATGNENPNVPGANLRDIPFELQLIQPITDGKSWEKAVELQGTDLSTLKEYTGNDVQKTNWSGTTKSDSTLTFSELPLGVYKLIQVEDEKGTTTPIDGSRETLVYIPMTNPENQRSWNYDVTIYPKNIYDPHVDPNDPDNPANPEFTKTVNDANKNVGEQLSYEITASIPDATVNDVTWFQITDEIDPTILKLAAVGVELNGGDPLVAEDYSIGSFDGNKVDVTFTERGLEKLTEARKANAASHVVVTINADIVQVGDGLVQNHANLMHNDPTVNSQYALNGPVKPGTEEPAVVEKPSNDGDSVDSFWGNIRISKTANSEDGKKLEGATFKLYRCSPNGEIAEGAEPLEFDHDNDPKTPVVSSVTTNEGGEAFFYGLQVTDFKNNVPLSDPDAYCLVETEAPDGFSLRPDPYVVELTKEATHGENGETTQVANIVNLAETRGSLPLTGGMGIGLIAALGALIVALGGYAAKRSGKSA